MADKKTQAAPTKSVKDAVGAPPPKGHPRDKGDLAALGPPDKTASSGPVHKAGPKPQLSGEQRQALGARRAKNAARPAFRRHEWWRYKKLKGKHAPWRVPSGIHSKVRRHFKYRPPLVSIGYRGPAEVRGLHPSGFEEVLVHNEADVAKLDKATQAARVGGTVGGRKAKLIEAAAAKAGIRVLNPRHTGGEA